MVTRVVRPRTVRRLHIPERNRLNANSVAKIQRRRMQSDVVDEVRVPVPPDRLFDSTQHIPQALPSSIVEVAAAQHHVTTASISSHAVSDADEDRSGILPIEDVGRS